MTLPRRRSSQNKCIKAYQQAVGNSRGGAQSVFFLAIFVATVLFINNVSHLGDVSSYHTHGGTNAAMMGTGKEYLLGNKAALTSSSSQAAPQPPPDVPEPPAKKEGDPDETVVAAVSANDGDKTKLTVDELVVAGKEDTKEENDNKADNDNDKQQNDPEDDDHGDDNKAEKSPHKNDGSKNNGSDFSKLSRAEQYAMFKAEVGILSDAPFETFLEKHKVIDEFDNTQRCRRYGYTFSAKEERNRRIFYGAVMADEPWELFEILSAESYGIFEAMVLIEPDHDIYGNPREPLRLEATQVLQSMFGVERVHILKYSNDQAKGDLLYDLAREEIVKEWKKLGMTVSDVGYMSNIDDMFARDLLKAIQHCELPEMKYDLHHCLHNRVKVFGNCQVYETSPECVSRTKKYIHPDMMIGACIQGIGSDTDNRLAPRDEEHGIYRQPGWTCEDREEEKDIKDQKYPLYTGTDMRQLCGGRQANVRAAMHQQYSAFHFRNFYNTAKDMRLQYTTEDALYDKSLDDLGEDMRVTYRCIKEIDDEKSAVTKREPGGFSVLKPMTPLYFADEKYRAAVHERAKKKILDDEKNVKSGGGGSTAKKTDDKKDAKKDTKKKTTTKKK
eukprot:scaffold4599_cov219-Amphora_coffeaeformis.AAC.14